MSDVSEGPGWWQASDGKWYAPELHPDYVPPAAPPTAEAAAEPPAPEPIAPEPTEPTAAEPIGPPPAGPPAGPPLGAPGGPPPPVVPGAVGGGGGGGGGAWKWIAIVVVLLLVAGGVAFALTRDSGGGSKDAFCKAARDHRDELNLSGETAEDRAKVLSAGNALADASPKEIKRDVQTVIDAYERLDNALRSAGSDPESQASAAQSIFSDVGTDVEAAGKRVDDYAKQNCGLTISTDDTESSFSSLGSSVN